jgi:putative ABC transport system permease protein
MNSFTLIRRSLRFYARAHLGVVLGAAVGSAALVGALVVGDSVRLSLRDLALARLGHVETAMASGDRLFRAQLGGQKIAAVLQLAGTAASEDASARANHVQILGVNTSFWNLANQPPAIGNLASDVVVLNQPLARQLKAKAGDTVVLRVAKPSLLSRDAPISPQGDSSVALRLKVQSVVSDEEFGRFSLQANQVAPFNAFVNLTNLQQVIGQTNRANLLLIPEISKIEFHGSIMVLKAINPLDPSAELRLPDETYTLAKPSLWEAIWDHNALENWRQGKEEADRMGGPLAEANRALRQSLRLRNRSFGWQLADASLNLRALPDNSGTELRSSRIFLDPPVVAAALSLSTDSALRTPHSALPQPVLTYFVNALHSGSNTTPYSMVTAMGAPVVPNDMRDDEILINDWLAEDLNAKPGDTLSLTYFVIGNGRALEQRTNEFRIHGIVPMTGAAADRGLMPDFPGIAEAESSSDWDAGMPINFKKIRPKDEQYWKQYRGTPKAFITLAAGQKMWANRFGNCSAIRFPQSAGSLDKVRTELLKKIDPASVGLSFQPVREQALAASSQAVDFGQLFIGFSFFLIVAALLLMGLLFQFGLEQRAQEIGTLLALGFRPRQVRRLFLGEGAALALIGGIIGALGGVFYAKAMLWGLATVWRSAVGTSALRYHATAQTLIIGVVSSSIVGAITIWFTLRRQARKPARELLAGGDESGAAPASAGWKRYLGLWAGPIAALLALGMIGEAIWQRDTSSAETFFSAGALLLIGGLGFSWSWLAAVGRRRHEKASAGLTLAGLGLRACGRRRNRSLATIGLLACGVFLIVAIGAFRVDANLSAHERSSGTGGFALLGESALPVTYDLNSAAGREFYGLNDSKLKDVSVVAFRMRDGDEASCLNLNRAQTPRLLGVNPEELHKRGAFTFAEVMKDLSPEKGWALLKPDAGSTNIESEIPAIGDENSILWAMGKKIGDTVDYHDAQGKPFKVRLVGALANSVLQGNLIIDEDEFVKRFPDESGYRMFLLDAPSNNVTEISGLMTRALRDAGLELTPAAQRLNEFNAVQNTYLDTFQVLGGLGLLLGSAGLGVVVLRNVQERRGELALLLAVGFRRRALQWLVLSEHGALLGLGLAVGIVAAVIGVLPALLSPGAQIPCASLAVTLAAVLLNGLIWTWLATQFALRGKLINALRNE